MQHTKMRDKKGPRINQDIVTHEVRLVDEKGELRGVVPTADAIERARAAGLDLVEVAPDATPPVCKILDYGKIRFEARKKRAAMKKKQKGFDIKELQFRVGIEDHDYQVKKRHAERFLKAGHKVRLVLRFKGREMGHQEIGVGVLNRLTADLADFGKMEAPFKTEGRRMLLVIVPLDAKEQKQRAAEKEKAALLAAAQQEKEPEEGTTATAASASEEVKESVQAKTIAKDMGAKEG